MKKLLYIANARIPTEKAHGIQIMKTCEALTNAGVEVFLIVPRRINPVKQDPFEYYGIEKGKFKIKYLPTIDFTFIWPRLFILQTAVFGIVVFFYLLFLRTKNNIIYTRGETVLFCRWFIWRKFSVFTEVHIKPRNLSKYLKAFVKCKGLVVVTSIFKKELIEKYNIDEEKILNAPDAVDLENFKQSSSKHEVREHLNIPQDKKIVVYAGSDIPWKGLETLKQAGKFLPENYVIYFVGAIKRHASAKGAELRFMGLKPFREIPAWLSAADVLVLTGTHKSLISQKYTSPLKLFEYMAARRPIVAAHIPSFTEVLNESNSILVKADNPESLAQGIVRAAENSNFADDLVSKAYADVQELTWDKRARKIIDFITKSV